MSPAEVMAKAFNEVYQKRCYNIDIVWEDMDPAERAVQIEAARAALLALAKMEPTLRMCEEARVYTDDAIIPCIDECVAFVLAAAAEGEQEGDDVTG